LLKLKSDILILVTQNHHIVIDFDLVLDI